MELVPAAPKVFSPVGHPPWSVLWPLQPAWFQFQIVASSRLETIKQAVFSAGMQALGETKLPSKTVVQSVQNEVLQACTVA